MNNNVYQHYKGYELFIKNLEQSINRYQKTNIPQVFGFLGIDEMKVAESYLGERINYQLFGGYDEAFNKRLIIGDELNEQDYICCLCASFNDRFFNLTHRDILGAVYNCGIDKSEFGDMWIEDNKIYLYVTREMQEAICRDLTQVNKAKIQFEPLADLPGQTFKFKERTVTVSSYRLDKILTQVIRKSREKCQSLIRNGNVNVNYRTIEDCDFMCHNNDILSVKGHGRYLIGEEVAVTRNDNYVVVIKQFV